MEVRKDIWIYHQIGSTPVSICEPISCPWQSRSCAALSASGLPKISQMWLRYSIQRLCYDTRGLSSRLEHRSMSKKGLSSYSESSSYLWWLFKMSRNCLVRNWVRIWFWIRPWWSSLRKYSKWGLRYFTPSR